MKKLQSNSVINVCAKTMGMTPTQAFAMKMCLNVPKNYDFAS